MTGLAQVYTTHLIASPSDRTIIAACDQVGCVAFHQGWTMTFDETTEQGAVAARYLRSGRSGRSFRELNRTADGLSVFRFDPYQRCFAEHRTRPELYVVRRGSPSVDLGLIRRHTNPVDWTEDLHETLDRRLTSTQRG